MRNMILAFHLKVSVQWRGYHILENWETKLELNHQEQKAVRKKG